MPEYVVRAALHEESNEGWVWVKSDSIAGIKSRSIVKITNLNNGRYIYTQLRKIDENFIKKYDNCPRIFIEPDFYIGDKNVICASEWYRDALYISTTAKDKKDDTSKLDISPINCGFLSFLYHIRAIAHHPELAIRMGLYLGILGAILGVIGIIPTILELFLKKSPILCIYILLVVFSIVIALRVCRPPKLTPDHTQSLSDQ